MGKRIWMALLLVSCVGAAFAAGPGAVRKQAESSLLVKGTIDIKADGTVADYTLEQQAALPEGIVGMIGKAVPQWRFEPIAFAPGITRARADMSLRIVAKKLDEQNYSLQIRGAHFGQDRPGESVAGIRLNPPRYPESAQWAGVGGTVYLVLKIDRDGRVEDLMTEQVNLRVVASEASMTKWRKLLAQAALRTAKAWTFAPPVKGEQVDAEYWSARVPVDFVAPGRLPAKTTDWEVYIPGPRESIPWVTEDSEANTDALAAGGVYQMGSGLRLLTQLGPG